MTYREKIQQLIKTIQSIYDDAEWLRDIATEDESLIGMKLEEYFILQMNH